MLTIRILSGLLTPLIAIIAVYIAYNQYSIQKSKLKHDLYDKRLRIYIETFNVVQKIMFNKFQVKDEYIRVYLHESVGCNFLFDKDVIQFIDKLNFTIKNLSVLNSALEDKTLYPEESESRKIDEQKRNSYINWLIENKDHIDDYFSKYLTLGNIL